MTRATQYACNHFATREQIKAEREARNKARLQKEEQRLNFILTGLYIVSTSTMQLLEYFDAQFIDRKAEADWRFARKKAANDIVEAVEKIRRIYKHNFMQDQNEVMTKHGTQDYDAESYDNHEDDARRWNKLLLHHMESSWQDEEAEARILAYYENLTHVGIFHPKDFRHFTTKR
jgi:hemin uptake protein HemP